MTQILAALTLVMMVAIVVTRVRLLRSAGTQAMHFGRIDKTDFLIPPVALLYFYMVFADAFHLPWASTQTLFYFSWLSWVGVFLCGAGLTVLVLSLVSFGKSFRVGIDVEHPDRLVTRGLFAFSRNPMYVAFGLVLLGQFLVFPHWIRLLYFVAAVLLFHRQVLREEGFMRQHYGDEFADYCRRVPRYF
jgi:protein-S-isoprenylcysteine O-methyltransferase Ste14